MNEQELAEFGQEAQSIDQENQREQMISELQGEIKRLREAVEEAKVKRGQFREIIEALLGPTNFIGIEAARDYIREALEDYGLAESA